jgi:hypothetical protein
MEVFEIDGININKIDTKLHAATLVPSVSLALIRGGPFVSRSIFASQALMQQANALSFLHCDVMLWIRCTRAKNISESRRSNVWRRVRALPPVHAGEFQVQVPKGEAGRYKQSSL